MNEISEEPQHISRRQLLQWVGAGLFVNVAGTLLYDPIGRISMPANEAFEALLLSSKPTPEFPISAIEPDKLIVNSFRGTPAIDLANFKLNISGAVNNPLSLKMADIQQFPLTSMVIRQVCVEGWAAIVQWGGVRMRDLLTLAQPRSGAKYVYFKSADGYYESWDLASVVHPQTLLAYQMNGRDLPKENGAPLRLAAPIKLGYKQSKWVTEIVVTEKLLPKRGYWEDLGYEWFAGL
ncbi:molybdopterin-dependent oxidoreductase [Chamaesiphon minutus]|uniref:Sulfite oxidase-like oxidoreductase n=1 Tax=Chamaesiphon minutus (strain ATCC 27169 / PCC 6605) TaxID=1173020 RepID=K9UHY5_CHAP6|nr:molybdopterin-dependent oxidoreductase [Chamaesiphon minutus]AFY94722.1 sulfite oxidase-like oxidoreductase [Chamaesiphon minutus PCC 6605]